MTATAIEFCREHGIDVKSEKLVDEIYTALIGGGKYRQPCRHKCKGQENETPIPNSD